MVWHGFGLENLCGAGHIPEMTKRQFYCPASGCIAAYNLTFLSTARTQPPRCDDCGQVFPITSDGKWLHYQPVDEAPLAPGAWA
jgi:hypothetical protein